MSNNIRLDDGIITFAEILRRRGYATGYAGKWHLDGDGKPQWAPKRKFGFTDNRFMFNRGHWKKLEDTDAGPAVASKNRRGRPDYGIEGADAKSFTTDWLTDKALDFIKAHRGEPFCYVVSFPDPHGPNKVRAPYDTMYADVEVPIPASFRKTAAQTPRWGRPDSSVSEQQLRRIMPAYYGMVKCIDDNVGRLLKSLRELEILERTMVVFTSDHGDLCGEHGRLNKGNPYEGSARIPFILYYPRKVRGGTVVNQALSCVDFLPTTLRLLEVPTAGLEQGRDASILFTAKAPEDWSDVAFLRGKAGWLCAVTDRYKLVFSPRDEPWLFDLAKDPDELNNVYGTAAQREVVRSLTRQLVEYAERYKDPNASQARVRQQLTAAMR